MSFINKYTHRTATKEATCWVCGKFTTAVLTSNDQDWFYVCVNHINDVSFCKPVAPPPPTPAPVQPAAPVPSKTTDKKDAADKKEAEKKGESSEKKKDDVKDKSSATASATDLKPATPSGPKQYILDSKIFFLREDQQRKKKAAQQARQVTAQLPSVPRNPF